MTIHICLPSKEACEKTDTVHVARSLSPASLPEGTDEGLAAPLPSAHTRSSAEGWWCSRMGAVRPVLGALVGLPAPGGVAVGLDGLSCVICQLHDEVCLCLWQTQVSLIAVSALSCTEECASVLTWKMGFLRCSHAEQPGDPGCSSSAGWNAGLRW